MSNRSRRLVLKALQSYERDEHSTNESIVLPKQQDKENVSPNNKSDNNNGEGATENCTEISLLKKIPEDSDFNKKTINIADINEIIFLDDYNNIEDVNILDSSFSNVITPKKTSVMNLSDLELLLPDIQPPVTAAAAAAQLVDEQEDTIAIPEQNYHGEKVLLPDNISNTGSPINELQPAEVLNKDNEIILEQTSDNENPIPEVFLQKTTKKGNDRKRRSYDLPLEERKKLKFDEKVAKFGVKPPCKCKRNCSELVPQDFMKSINKQFWALNWQAQRIFVLNNAEKLEVARKKQDSSRNVTYKYFLPKNGSGTTKVQVCKVFFLATLGYRPGNDTMLLNTLSSVLLPSNDNTEHITAMPIVQDRRGRHPSTRKLDRSVIENHIKLFKPSISHYRREHAPNRLYLPSDISAITMFRDFQEQHKEFQCSIDLYRLVLKEMNISFTRLGHEECEDCTTFKNHGHEEENINIECDCCQKYVKHKNKYTRARKAYTIDAERGENNDEVFFSADLQKVIMLPRMEEFKICIFTPRIIAFNESFVPLGKKSKNKPIATLWHEGLAGRKKEEIISTFYNFFLLNRDAKKITLWLDNCSSQNKNWCFLSFLVYIVNSPNISSEQIIIKYFEPGHTFMSADSFHHQVELSMKNKKVCDFSDFTNCVKLTNSEKVVVKNLDVNDIFYWPDLSSQAKIRKCDPRPYLNDMVQIMAVKGSYSLKYWTDFESEKSFELDFLKVNVIKNGLTLPKPHAEARGIPEEKKMPLSKTCAL